MFAAVISLMLLAQPQGSPLPARPAVSLETGGLKGEVRGLDGHPVPGVQVRLMRPGGSPWVAFTDDKGAFQAGSLPPGEYQVELLKEKHPTVTYPRILIKANAWLLGVSEEPRQQPKAAPARLRLVGPATYEYATGLLDPKTRPKLEKIPMH